MMTAGVLGLGFHAHGELLAGTEGTQWLTHDLTGHDAGVAAFVRDRLNAVRKLHENFDLLGGLRAAVGDLQLVRRRLAGRYWAGWVLHDELQVGDGFDFSIGGAGAGTACGGRGPE